MNINIKKLTPDLVDDYARFFDTTPHNPSGNGDKCYCITFCKDCVYSDGGSYWYPTADERRLHGINRVKDGNIQGYLAYMDGVVVGWCNAGAKADYKEVFDHMRSDKIPVDECTEGEKINFIFCFVIAPKVHRMGVATELLEYILKDAKQEGFDIIEAHTYKDFLRDGFKGMLSLYKKCDFYVHKEEHLDLIVRKKLK